MPNPALQAVLAFVQSKLAEAEGKSLPEMRAALDAGAKLAPPLPGVRYEPVETGVVDSAWATPDGAEPGRAVVYVHGGGYTLGSVESYRDLACRIALATKAKTLVFNYRLAPEHPYPAALDDAIASYRWVISDAGFAPAKVGVVGDSAGGGMALALALAARDRDELSSPGCVAAMSPWTDLTCSSPSMVRDADPSMMLPYVMMMAQAYLAGTDAKEPMASPIYAELGDLPPILLQAGTADGLRDDVQLFAEKGRAAGVDVKVELFDEMFHAFQLYAAMLPDAQRALDSLGEFVRAHT